MPVGLVFCVKSREWFLNGVGFTHKRQHILLPSYELFCFSQWLVLVSFVESISSLSNQCYSRFVFSFSVTWPILISWLHHTLYVYLNLSCCTTAFKNLRIRVGGSLQDQVVYELGNLSSSCQPFTKQKGGLFGFSKGCLPMRRWDELNQFFKKTG